MWVQLECGRYVVVQSYDRHPASNIGWLTLAGQKEPLLLTGAVRDAFEAALKRRAFTRAELAGLYPLDALKAEDLAA